MVISAIDTDLTRQSYLPLDISAVRTSHLVAAILLDERVLALIAMSNQRGRHGFFYDMSQRELAILLSFFTAERDVRLFLTKPAACLATLLLILASELLVDLDGRTFHLEVTEGALR